jgi:hypothetical protein
LRPAPHPMSTASGCACASISAAPRSSSTRRSVRSWRILQRSTATPGCSGQRVHSLNLPCRRIILHEAALACDACRCTDVRRGPSGAARSFQTEHPICIPKGCVSLSLDSLGGSPQPGGSRFIRVA